jgi:hypothetical protein
MRNDNNRQACGWTTFAFEILTVAATFCLLLGIKILWPEVLASSRLIPRGTVLTVKLDSPVSSQTARLGDEFQGRVITASGTDALAALLADARVVGRCVAVRNGQPGGEPGYVRLALSGLRDLEGHVTPLDTSTVSLWGGRPMGSDGTAELIDSPTLATGAAPMPSAQHSDEVVVAPGQQLRFVLLSPAVVAYHRTGFSE